MALEDFDRIESIRGSDFREFYEEFVVHSNPVIIQNLWDDYPARQKWTPEFLKDGLGNMIVDVYESGNEWPHPKCKKMKFGDYLDALAANEDNNLFINGLNIFAQKKGLANDFKRSKLPGYFHGLASMFFGCRQASSRLKQNAGSVQIFHTLLHGAKHVTLIPPKFSDLLYKIPFEQESLANIETLNYFHFPGFKYVRAMQATLYPGDTLFVPSGYWHHIRYVEGGYAVNQRNLPQRIGDFAKGIWNAEVLPFFDAGVQKILGSTWERYKISRSRHKVNRQVYLMSVEKKFKNMLPENEKNALTSKYFE